MTKEYFIGGETEDFSGTVNEISWQTTAGSFDPDFASGSVRIWGIAASTGTTVGGGFLSVDLRENASGEVWTTFRLYTTNVAAANTLVDTDVWCEFRDSSGAPFLRLLGAAAAATPSFNFQYWNGAAWTTIGSTVVLAAATLYKFDFKLLFHASAGEFVCYVNGVAVASRTGAKTDYAANLASIRLFTMGVSVTQHGFFLSEFMVLDEDTRNQRLATLRPNGVGATNTWSGAYTDVNEVGAPIETTMMGSTASGQKFTFGMGDLSLAASALSVRSVIPKAHAANGATGPQSVRPVARTGGADYTGADVSLTGYLSGVSGTGWQVSPATGVPWTVAEVNALEQGWESRP